MVFSSIYFLVIFLPVFFGLYMLADKRFKNLLILAASIYFYAYGAPRFVFILLASTIIDYYLVGMLYQSRERRQKRIFLSLSVILNLGLLIYFKYANFFVENVNAFLYHFGMEMVGWTQVVLPIGISFYTFQTLTYSIDVYRNAHKPFDKLGNYLLYIMSFPQMIAGPIVRFNQIADEIINRRDTVDDKLQGFIRFVIGLSKKVLIANLIGEQADLIFQQDFANLSTSSAWIGITAYTFQIYFDFSGYSDMAIGLGRMMGFHFPENFDSPYTSRSISEFWRRWHITLGEFMKYYLYIPLGGNRVPRYRMFFNLWIVFLLSGLWHGPSWNFVIWGAFHGLFLVLDRLFLLKWLEQIGKIPSVLLTFVIVMTGWVFFRIENLHEATQFIKALYGFRSGETVELQPVFLAVLPVAVLFSFITLLPVGRKLERITFSYEFPPLRWYLGFGVLSIFFYILCLSFVTTADFNPFIYFRF